MKVKDRTAVERDHGYMSKTLHVVFKTHLDVGFTDYAAAVKQRYFDTYIPQALRIARGLREEGGPDRFVWTTGSWIIYEYLEQADHDARKAAEEGIRAGDLRWHGLPFTMHSELLDPDLFRFGLGLSQELDKRFGTRTIAAKMTDVPGHTRGIVPLMAESGLRFLHIGVNAASRAPDVPGLFRWREPESGAEIVVMYHKDGYGGASRIEGFDHALGFAHTGDNLGPQSQEEVIRALNHYRSLFPDFEVKASTLDEFAEQVELIRESLPLIREEIGDTWIHGTASDPWKMAGFRALLRLRARWVAQGRDAADAPGFHRFSRELLTVAEHTWGMDAKMHLADYQNYSRADFTRARAIDIVFDEAPRQFSFAEGYKLHGQPQSYRKIEASWREQRAYLHRAVAALHDPRLRAEARNSLHAGSATRIAREGALLGKELGKAQETAHFRVRFSPTNGSIISLVDKRNGKSWARNKSPLALFHYQSFSAADYERFLREFVVNLDNMEIHSWAAPDYGRLGLTSAHSESALYVPRVVEARRSGERFLFDLRLPSRPRERFGAPAALQLRYTFPAREPCIEIEFSWFDKPASRLPEAAWLSFVPLVNAVDKWEIHKLGRWISPIEIVSRGNRNMHGIGEGVRVSRGGCQVVIESKDAHLVSPGALRLLQFDDTLPRLEAGMHFCLHANLYSTNFPLWYEDDARFRFRLRFPFPHG
ncbi:MAG: DUF5054 domain-containing protein [Spirochaetia bacterium]